MFGEKAYYHRRYDAEIPPCSWIVASWGQTHCETVKLSVKYV